MDNLVLSTMGSDLMLGGPKYPRDPLDVFFTPQSVAVIGASEQPASLGRILLWNLISSPFGGTVYPVNPRHASVLGIKTYPTLAAVPDRVDLAVIATPAATVPQVMAECVAAGVKGAIIISAGFKETGPAGVELERQVLDCARRGHMRLIGPNCLGVMRPLTGLNATFANGIARPGSVGFLSQSGALLTAVLDWSRGENVGFSTCVSLGSMLDVGWGDLIYYLGDDPQTRSILLYMETIGDARAFLSAAREVALSKPIIVIKPGRTEQAARAAASHTGALTGSDEVLAAAFDRVGVLRVDSIADLFNMAEVLGKQPLPRGRRLTIVTNAGGPGVLATDSLISGGGALAPLAPPTLDALNGILPAAWSHNNPVDILGDATPERYATALSTLAKDPQSDGLLVILTPQPMTDPTATAQQLTAYSHLEGKPVLASWMGGDAVAPGTTVLNQANIPTFSYPDVAVQMFNYMGRYSANLRHLYETPTLAADADSVFNRVQAAKIIAAARDAGRTLLTEVESKELLAAYRIPIVETRIARSVDEAVACARAIGYPVVVKLYSHTITHKTDVGGVQLNLLDDAAVRQAYGAIEHAVGIRAGAAHFEGVTVQRMINWSGYELIAGSSIDPQFGPVLLFGMGGQLVEVFKDRALGLPPLNSTLARLMMERTRIYAALQGVRGRKAVNLEALAQLLVRFSQLVVEQRWVKEIEINPLLASAEQLIALDARVVLYEADVSEGDLPRPAIRPYPLQYVGHWTTPDGVSLTIRPIHPEDEPLLVAFHGRLSAQSVYGRYLQPLGYGERVAHERLTRVCCNDYDRELALVAERQGVAGGPSEIVGSARLSKVHGAAEGRFAIVVSDDFQQRRLGTELLRRLIGIARDEKLGRLVGYFRSENGGMRRLAEREGFRIVPAGQDDLLCAEIRLAPAGDDPSQ